MNKRTAEQMASKVCYGFGLDAGPKTDELIGRVAWLVLDVYDGGWTDGQNYGRTKRKPSQYRRLLNAAKVLLEYVEDERGWEPNDTAEPNELADPLVSMVVEARAAIAVVGS